VRLDPLTAPLVAEMFARYSTEEGSLLGLAKTFTQLSIRSPYGKARWNAGTLHGILSNPVYTGVVYAGRMRTRLVETRLSPLRLVPPPTRSTHITPPSDWTLVAHVPAIVTQELFDQVQAKLAQNQRWATRHNTAYEYLLRALVSCGACQRACMGCARRQLRYYMCIGKGNPVVVGRDTKCRSRYIPATQLDTLVWQDLCTLLQQPDLIHDALRRAQAGDWLPQEVQARRDGLRKAQAHLDQQLERLTTAYLDHIIPLDEYRRRRRDIEQRQQSFDTQIRHLEAQAAHQANLAALSASIEDFCTRVQAGLDNATFAQKRQLVELLVDRVVVTNEDVEIRYVIPTSPDSEQIKFYQLRLDYFNIGLPRLAFGDLFLGDAERRINLERLIGAKHAPAVAHQRLRRAMLSYRGIEHN
jgi:site-specific DNA recombinase